MEKTNTAPAITIDLTKTANGEFEIAKEAPTGNLPMVIDTTPPGVTSAAGSLNYRTNASAEERALMDAIISTIDLTNSDSIINIGAQERETLAKIADQVLDSAQPGAKLAWARAFKDVANVVDTRSLEATKNRIKGGAIRRALRSIINAITGGDSRVFSEKDLAKFMTDVTTSRIMIEEAVTKLQDQEANLITNYANIQKMAQATVDAAKAMMLVRGATEEFITRVNEGSDTTLSDLQALVNDKGRPDDITKFQEAMTNWNGLRQADNDLLGSIGVYDLNIARSAFVKQANMQNRLQTAMALKKSVPEWKIQLAFFSTMTEEAIAGQMIQQVNKLNAKALQGNQDMFDVLADITIKNATGSYSLRQVMEQQSQLSTKLKGIHDKIEEQFDEMAKEAKEAGPKFAEFRKSIGATFKQNGGLMNGAPKPANQNNNKMPKI